MRGSAGSPLTVLSVLLRTACCSPFGRNGRCWKVAGPAMCLMTNRHGPALASSSLPTERALLFKDASEAAQVLNRDAG